MIKLFEDFNSEKDVIIRNLGKLGIYGTYQINSDLTVDINGGVYIQDLDIEKLPVRFNRINSWFAMFNMSRLTTLEGCPKKTGNGFSCVNTLITSLEGCPIDIGKESFNIPQNKLTSLEFSPKEVNDYYCYINELTNLNGSAEIVNGGFNCSRNKLTSLENGPKYVDGVYNVTDNDIYSLEGFECDFRSNFYIYDNPIEFVFPFGLVETDKKDVEHFINYKIIVDRKVNFKKLKFFYNIHKMGFDPEVIESNLINNGYEII